MQQSIIDNLSELTYHCYVYERCCYFFRLSELNKVNMNDHARALHAMLSSPEHDQNKKENEDACKAIAFRYDRPLGDPTRDRQTGQCGENHPRAAGSQCSPG